MSFLSMITPLYKRRYPVRGALRRIVRALKIGRYEERLRIGAVPRPQYGFCLYSAAMLARRLGYQRISAIEFGVAGGRGLLALERHADEISRCLGVEIEIYGFDTGKGLPPPQDYRDMPYIWKQGFFQMNREELQSRLGRAKLIIGDVAATVPEFVERHKPAPIGTAMIDLDYYSATASALRIFEAADEYLLPRAYCYFDDVVAHDPLSAFNDFTGERLAIAKFNQRNTDRQMAVPYLSGFIDEWIQQIWVLHVFHHPRYADFVRDYEVTQLPLER
jgi:hypothetical protein